MCDDGDPRCKIIRRSHPRGGPRAPPRRYQAGPTPGGDVVPPRPSDDRAERVEAAVKGIRALHELGEQILQPAKAEARELSPHEVSDEQDRRGLNHETTLRKAVQFATLYDRAALERLIRTIKVHEPRDDPAVPVFGPSAVKVLLTAGPDRVEDKRLDELQRLQDRAIAEGWSTAQLEAAVRAGKRRLRSGGRPPKLPGDVPALRAKIWSACRTWQRFMKGLDAHRKKGRLPAGPLRRLAAVDAAVGEAIGLVEPAGRRRGG